MTSDISVVALSVQIALVATTVTLPVGMLLAWLLVRKNFRGKFVLDVFVSLPLALPPVVVGYASLPLVVRSFAASLAGVDPRLEVAARGLGAGSIRTLLTITLPLAYRGVIAGVLLGFVRALSEFGATIIVAGNIPGRTQTLPSAIFTRISAGDTGDAWRLALVSVVLGVIALAVHNWLLKRTATGISSSNGGSR